jgi:hypothetical protein
MAYIPIFAVKVYDFDEWIRYKFNNLIINKKYVNRFYYIKDTFEITVEMMIFSKKSRILIFYNN